MSDEPTSYDHTQRAPLHWMLHAIAVVLLVGAWLARDDWPGAAIFAATAVLMFLLGLMFTHMTVRDEGDCLAIRYGPLPVFRHRIRYHEITSVDPGRSALIDGWGIHSIPGRGSTYNLWGFDCVKLTVNGKTVRIGSDDVDNLLSFLATKTNQTE